MVDQKVSENPLKVWKPCFFLRQFAIPGIVLQPSWGTLFFFEIHIQINFKNPTSAALLVAVFASRRQKIKNCTAKFRINFAWFSLWLPQIASSPSSICLYLNFCKLLEAIVFLGGQRMSKFFVLANSFEGTGNTRCLFEAYQVVF